MRDAGCQVCTKLSRIAPASLTKGKANAARSTRWGKPRIARSHVTRYTHGESERWSASNWGSAGRTTYTSITCCLAGRIYTTAQELGRPIVWTDQTDSTQRSNRYRIPPPSFSDEYTRIWISCRFTSIFRLFPKHPFLLWRTLTCRCAWSTPSL
jgi:hypothetical protein